MKYGDYFYIGMIMNFFSTFLKTTLHVSNDCYIVTGGAIKLTLEMAQRSHTIRELDKMKMCLQYLKENGIYDNKGITETIEFD